MPSYAFPRERRLLSSEEYNHVFKKPFRAGNKGMLILACPNELDTPRLGLVVPKKVLKKAAWRNRVKRLVRESFRLRQHELPHADLVFLARPGIKEYTNHDFSAALDTLWAQISHQLNKQRSS